MVFNEKNDVELVGQTESRTLYYFRFSDSEITTLTYNMRKKGFNNIPDYLKALIKIGLKT